MLSLIDPSLLVRLVASMPLKSKLVLVVLVPLTEGEMLPVPLIRTGGRSALTPASDDNRWVKLPVDVGTASNSALVRLRAVVDVVMASRFASAVTCTVSLSPPTSSVTGTDRVVAASTMMPPRTSRLKPSSSNAMDAGRRKPGNTPITFCPGDRLLGQPGLCALGNDCDAREHGTARIDNGSGQGARRTALCAAWRGSNEEHRHDSRDNSHGQRTVETHRFTSAHSREQHLPGEVSERQ